MLAQAFGGARGGLFSLDNNGAQGRNLFQPDSGLFASPVTTAAPEPAAKPEPNRKQSITQQAAQNRGNQAAAGKKIPAAANGT
jgi:hypothetical protein